MGVNNKERDNKGAKRVWSILRALKLQQIKENNSLKFYIFKHL